MKNIFALLLCLTATLSFSQNQQAAVSSSEIYQKIEKLNVLGNVLYLAAHPDDENTRFIAYSSKEKLYNTSYLSLTRGSGGQNLIGPEIRDALGIIRTQELLAARRTDGGSQYFSRANDFGYSKTADETFEIWDRELVFWDVVWVIRQLKPDVIVLRFPPDERGGHGHHTASAMLGIEAFTKAADSTVFPEQLKYVDTWQAKRVVTNTGRWWNPDISANDPGIVAEDIGAYSQLLGLSMNEIAAHARSQHKSQGFGTSPTRGSEMEYFEHQKGSQATASVFEGVDYTWNRVKGSENVQKKLNTILKSYDFSAPEKSIASLLELRREIARLNDPFWKKIKIREVNEIIKDCAGLFISASTNKYSATPNDSVQVNFKLLNRSSVAITAYKIKSGIQSEAQPLHHVLEPNIEYEESFAYSLKKIPYTQPYWLKNKGSLGMYKVDDINLIGKAETDPALEFTLIFQFGKDSIEYTIPAMYRTNDPVKGEVTEPFVVTPPVFVNFQKGIYLYPNEVAQSIGFTVQTAIDNFEGTLHLNAPEGWTLEKNDIDLSFEKAGEEQTFTITVSPAENAVNGALEAVISSGTEKYHYSLQKIAYDHIPTQINLPDATTDLVFVNLKRPDVKIGYLEGAGDVVADNLRNIGYEVDLLQENDLSPENLKQYGTVITGVRIINTNDRIDYIMPKLMDYVKAGGNLIMQYNTSYRMKTEDFAPYPLTLSRDRVTEEIAEVTFLEPKHPVLNTPNKITEADFNHWVQERGLYFPNEWDKKYDAILSWNDKGEEAKKGALLITEYGKGHFVYTGISFFRELPAGVPGAYRLFVNLISLGEE